MHPGATVLLEGMTLTRGTAPSGSAHGNGGIISSCGALTLRNMSLTDGTANHGGCIHQRCGNLLLEQTDLSVCTAMSDGGALLLEMGNASLVGANVTRCMAGVGGGIANRAIAGSLTAPTLSVAASVISANSARVGGALFRCCPMGPHSHSPWDPTLTAQLKGPEGPHSHLGCRYSIPHIAPPSWCMGPHLHGH